MMLSYFIRVDSIIKMDYYDLRVTPLWFSVLQLNYDLYNYNTILKLYQQLVKKTQLIPMSSIPKTESGPIAYLYGYVHFYAAVSS